MSRRCSVVLNGFTLIPFAIIIAFECCRLVRRRRGISGNIAEQIREAHQRAGDRKRPAERQSDRRLGKLPGQPDCHVEDHRKPAIAALKSLVPQITELIDKLLDLMGKLKTEIQNLNVNAIPGLNEVSTFTDKMKNFLNTAKTLLPDEASEIDSVLEVANLVTGLPSTGPCRNPLRRWSSWRNDLLIAASWILLGPCWSAFPPCRS